MTVTWSMPMFLEKEIFTEFLWAGLMSCQMQNLFAGSIKKERNFQQIYILFAGNGHSEDSDVQENS